MHLVRRVQQLAVHGLLEVREREVMTPEWFTRDVIRPANEGEREAVRVVQRALRLNPTGEMDAATTASLRGAQRLYGVPVTGILDAATAVVIDRMRPWQVEEENGCPRKY